MGVSHGLAVEPMTIAQMIYSDFGEVTQYLIVDDDKGIINLFKVDFEYMPTLCSG